MSCGARAPASSNVNSRKRQATCALLNQFLFDAHEDNSESSASGYVKRSARSRLVSPRPPRPPCRHLVPQDLHQPDPGLSAAASEALLAHTASYSGINAVGRPRGSTDGGASYGGSSFGDASYGGSALERSLSSSVPMDPVRRLLHDQARAKDRSTSGGAPPPGVAAALLHMSGDALLHVSDGRQ